MTKLFFNIYHSYQSSYPVGELFIYQGFQVIQIKEFKANNKTYTNGIQIITKNGKLVQF